MVDETGQVKRIVLQPMLAMYVSANHGHSETLLHDATLWFFRFHFLFCLLTIDSLCSG